MIAAYQLLIEGGKLTPPTKDAIFVARYEPGEYQSLHRDGRATGREKKIDEECAGHRGGELCTGSCTGMCDFLSIVSILKKNLI